ncbi:hypothetical protein LAUMK41_05491 [Mycobacterium attenuatum]|nr:hypothetical protein LAUMK41_05491 [Mycobacterium attenuatum]
MRLSARNFDAKVGVVHQSWRPIRLRIIGLTFGLTSAEALQLATDLADAVSDTNSTERTAS